MTPSTDKLRALAMAATPGPWERVTTPRYLSWAVTDKTGGVVVEQRDDMFGREAAFIAAANPQMVIALLDEVERLRRDKQIACDLGDEYQAARDEYRQQLAVVQRERDEARAECEQLKQGIVTDAHYDSMLGRLNAEVERMRAVYEAAVEWSESFGELSKRLPLHVHKLRDAVDAALSTTHNGGGDDS